MSIPARDEKSLEGFTREEDEVVEVKDWVGEVAVRRSEEEDKTES